LTKGLLFLQDKDRVKTLSKRRIMTQKKMCSKLNELQEVLLNDKDFLKRAIESFCQKLLKEEITQFLKADKYHR